MIVYINFNYCDENIMKITQIELTNDNNVINVSSTFNDYIMKNEFIYITQLYQFVKTFDNVICCDFNDDSFDFFIMNDDKKTSSYCYIEYKNCYNEYENSIDKLYFCNNVENSRNILLHNNDCNCHENNDEKCETCYNDIENLRKYEIYNK